jgi:hypothetical protein
VRLRAVYAARRRHSPLEGCAAPDAPEHEREHLESAPKKRICTLGAGTARSGVETLVIGNSAAGDGNRFVETAVVVLTLPRSLPELDRYSASRIASQLVAMWERGGSQDGNSYSAMRLWT